MMRAISFSVGLAVAIAGATACLEGRDARWASPEAPSAASAAQAADKFDSGRAWEHLKQIVAIGPRPSGSPALRQTRAYITRQISAMGLSVQEQTWTATTPNGPVEMVNLIVRLPGKRAEKILFTGHYDTKIAKDFQFVGANDAGSSAAFLIELARVLKDRPREFTWEFVWFDGEEAVCWDWYECGKPGAPDNTYGSRHYVDQAKAAGAIPSLKAMILVDMIGERNARFLREADSTAWLKDIIWAAAKKAGHGQYFVDAETPITDDHIPFLQAGVPAVDIIDLDYTAWHTAQDTLDKLSSASLQAVGDTLLVAIPEIEQRLSR